MADRIDMSLDEIIKANKSARGNVVKGDHGVVGARKSGPNPRRRRPIKNEKLTKKKMGRNRRSRERSYPKNDIERGSNVEGRRSSHKRASKSTEILDRTPGLKTGHRLGKLMVSNLDLKVSMNDLHELFSEFGELKSASVHYDRSGISLGTADIVYIKKSDAIKAIKQYDGVPLDGKAMRIEMATSDVQNNIMMLKPRSPSFGPKRRKNYSVRKPVGGKIIKRESRRNQTGARASGGAKKKRKVVAGRGTSQNSQQIKNKRKATKKFSAPDKDTLDKELDEFMKDRRV